MSRLVIPARAAAVLAVAAVFAACAGDPVSVPTGIVARADITTNAVKTLQVCKIGPLGTYDYTLMRSGNVNTNDVYAGAVVSTDVHTIQITTTSTTQPACTTIYTRTISDNPTGDQLVNLKVTETVPATQTLQSITFATSDQAPAPIIANPSITMYLNAFHSGTATFTNTLNPVPPAAVCDFITFGRLVTEINGKKVVISGNAGGNNADGSIKSEFHIEANGVDNHVADVDSYGPIASGVFFGLTNSRITTGTAKNGVKVELRLWDGGEPGKGTDRVYVKLNGVELLGPSGQYIDQGNMQYHDNCRGPKQ